MKLELGTDWLDCILIYDGEDVLPNMGEKIYRKLEQYQKKFPYSTNKNIWYDISAIEKKCFSSQQFRGTIAGKDHHFNSPEKKFLNGPWGKRFCTNLVDKFDNKVFKNQEIISNDEIIFSKPEFLNKFVGSKVLIMGGGPTTNLVNWQNIDYDYIWSCNNFYKNSAFRDLEIDLVTMAPEIGLLKNEEFISYVERCHNTVFSFEIERGDYLNDHKNLHNFVKTYPNRCSFHNTRYRSVTGIGSRLICYAILLGVREIYFVGALDGVKNADQREIRQLHSFEEGKGFPTWYKKITRQGIDPVNFERRQYVVYWDYIASLLERYDFKIYNLGEEHSCCTSSDITSRYFPLPDCIREKL